MKQFAVALLAAIASANGWQNLNMVKDGGQYPNDYFVRSQDWSTATVQDKTLTIGGNNSMSIQLAQTEDVAANFKPYVRGGSIEYDVNLSAIESGCVAGVYMVETDGRCDPNAEKGSSSQCRSIDAMNANKYGFETQANPCSNGTCDAVSQCIIGMQSEAQQIHGADAYGPGGSKIDTNNTFHVHNEFVSTRDYRTLWKLRTTLSQNGNAIVMESDCQDYLVGLNGPIEGEMNIVFSSWQATAAEDFELNYGQPQADSCDASAVFSNFVVSQTGSGEDIPQPPAPEPEPQPDPEPPQPEPVEPVLAGFNAFTDYYGGDWGMTAMGLAGKELSASGSTVTMGNNNRAWILDYPNDEDIYWSYWHDYLGGTFEFEVDLAEIGCGQSAGMYLVQADNGDCSWNAKDQDVNPQCSRIELMEANINSFKASSYPCDFETCADGTDSSVVAPASAYGPGTGFTIDTLRPFTVKTKFFADVTQTVAEEMGDLTKIETCLIQDGNEVHLAQMNADYLYPLRSKLQFSMAAVMSNFGNPDAQCTETVSTTGKVNMSELKWTQRDSLDNGETDDGSNDGSDDGEPAVVVVTETVAPQIGMCLESDCSACNMAHMSNDTTNMFPVCTEFVQYKYSNLCGSNQNSDKCGADDICIRSWPADDPEKWRSDDFACRPLRQNLIEGDFTFARRTKPMNKGLCALGCTGTCHNSWPVGDPERWRSADAIIRCQP